VAALTALPGWRCLFEDNFAGGLKAWAVSGKPSAAAGSVVLNEPGQALAYAPAAPLTAGRVGVNFREAEPAGRYRWYLEAQFDGEKGPRKVRVTVTGPAGRYEVEAAGLTGTAQPLARAPGWHRLVVQFTPGSLRVTCDDAVLWYSLKEGPGGALCRVVLGCEEAGKPGGVVAWAAFALERQERTTSHPPGDAGQDEVWLDGDEQLFGRIVKADRRGVQIEGRFGGRTFPWADVRGCYFRRAAVRGQDLAGAHVRLWLRSGLDPDADVLEGVVTRLDDSRVTLRHALLGELQLDRARVVQVQPLSHRRRVEQDPTFPHTGEPAARRNALL
jgi:hypothetical protein